MANTAKRALLILLSIFIFHNPVTVVNVFGILLVILGVVLYNRAREYEKLQASHKQTIESKV